MEIFIRYAAHTNYLPNRRLTKAYDARFLFITKGSGTIYFQDNILSFSADTLIYYPPGTAYLPIADDFKNIKFITLNFDFTQKASETTTTLSPVPIEQFEDQKAINSHLEIDIPLFQEPFVINGLSNYRNYFLDVVNEHQKQTKRSKETASSLLQYICCRLAEYGTEQKQDICHEIMDYVKEHYKDLKSIEEIAHIFNYHPVYLSSLFKRTTGIGLHKYIMDYKLSQGAELLHTHMSIAEIATDVGFCNADHFSKCFLKKYGQTPTAYRKSGFLV